jgi:hypothetical protein
MSSKQERVPGPDLAGTSGSRRYFWNFGTSETSGTFRNSGFRNSEPSGIQEL